MNGIILYKSKYGAIKKYVNWLVEETGFASSEIAKVKLTDIMAYDVIVIGGGIYASGVAGLIF